MNKNIYALTACLLALAPAATGQQKIKDGTIASGALPAADALLELESSNKGLLLPRIALTATTAAAPLAAHTAGMAVYNTATAGDVTPGYYYNDGAKWVRLADAASIGQQDLRLLSGTANHITQDAGVGANGTSVGTGINMIGIGQNALSQNTTGYNGIAIGTDALSQNTTGYQNIAIGERALKNNTTGPNNLGVGNGSLVENTTGFHNVAVGSGAIQDNTTGYRNIAIGVNAMLLSTTGNSNTAVGDGAMYGSSTADSSVAVGRSAMQNVSGSSNTAVGSYAGYNLSTGSNNIALGANTDLASATGSDQMNIGNLIFGTGMTGTVFAPAGNVGIGTAAPANKLHVSATTDPLRLEGLQGGAATDSIMTVDATGVVKKRSAADVASNTEPWYNVATNTGATANTQDIYQMGKIGVGTDAPQAELHTIGNIIATDPADLKRAALTSDGGVELLETLLSPLKTPGLLILRTALPMILTPE